MKTVTLAVKGLNFAGCAREIEKSLGKLAPITKVEASYVSQTATFTYDETILSEAQLKEMVKGCGFDCGQSLTDTLPALDGARAHHDMSATPALERPGMGHGMMEHDMSDPLMAKQMEAGMRNRFFVSLILTIPVVLYSPLGVNL
ncbi:MAG TPA: heavy-metal-associated domain-containing protein, partial [Ktedonobacteraceae bacterium]|nr:heavy-metal-associated domain-containing protein [Ktedonobacteraceae bacterium]